MVNYSGALLLINLILSRPNRPKFLLLLQTTIHDALKKVYEKYVNEGYYAITYTSMAKVECFLGKKLNIADVAF